MEKKIVGFEKPIYVTKSFLPPIEEYEKELEIIWRNNWLTNKGPLHEKLEKKLIEFLKVNDCILFANGHLALDIAIKSLNLSGEVITTPFTFASTTHAITINGLSPVFCDIDINDYNIDVKKIEKLITDKTTAIIPVHVYGTPCNTIQIETIAKKYGLKVIYDAAHATAVEVDEVGIGNFGDISMFSFHATKVFNTIEGGLLTFNNNNLNKSLEQYKNFGITGPESVDSIGMNAKMNEFQAAMGLVNLKYIYDQIDKRKNISELYAKELSEIDGIKLLEIKQNVKSNYAYFPILLDESKCISRDNLYNELQKYNIFTRKYFYPLVTQYTCYKNKYDDSDLQNAKFVADRILTIPIYGNLELEDVAKIIKIIKYIIATNKK